MIVNINIFRRALYTAFPSSALSFDSLNAMFDKQILTLM